MERKDANLGPPSLAISISIAFLLLVLGFFATPSEAFATKAKHKQKPLQIVSNTGGTGYLKLPVTLSATGGSGSGRVTFSVKTGPCVYISSKDSAPNGVGLYATSTTPTFCSVFAKKASDRNYSETGSKPLNIYFDYLPGYYKLNSIQALIPLELSNWALPEGRLDKPSPNDSFDQLVKASQSSEIRYAPYWLALNAFWQQRLNVLRATDTYYNSKWEEFAYKGISNSGAARLLGEKQLIQTNLKPIVQTQIVVTWSNYLRDINSVYK